MIVTIDGPAGTGKSTVARLLAQQLGFEYLDTGSMYRMVAYKAVQAGGDLTNADWISQIAEASRMDFCEGRTLLDGADVSTSLRTTEVSRAASIVAQNPAVRETLVQRQREIADHRQIVCEGRDQGTVVFPHAEFKFFLTAQPEVRARRRLAELQQAGTGIDLESLLREQQERDRRDEERLIAPLKPAVDAEIVDTTELQLDEVVHLLFTRVQPRLSGR
ncbi:(d)CMP kinase [Planctomicrobium sp. SH664]|uniref:(d)CMP kinase n=1 Tax=Planctomicrobium sp. SH664 TaxID=3448125 RepID=UPI003F5C8173